MRVADDRDVRAFAANLPGAAFYFWRDQTGAEHLEVLNERCSEIWALPVAVIERHPDRLWDMVHPEDLAAMKATVQRSAQSLSVWDTRFRMTDARGAEKSLLARGTPEKLPGGVRWLTFLFDVTEEVRTETLFHRVTRQLDFISNAIPDGFALFDPEERLVVCNRLFRQTYGLPETIDPRGISYGDILRYATQHLHIPGVERNAEAWIDAALANFRNGVDRPEMEWDDGRWMRILDRPTEDGGRVAFRIEITEAERQKRALEKAAETDPVTGLLNRRGLSRRLTDLQALWCHKGTLLVLHIDLDKFKSINDAYGHDTGDGVLKTLADRLRNRLDDEALIARAGGDEFVAVLPRGPAMADPEDFAEALRASLLEPINFNSCSCRVGATLGFAEWKPDGSVTIEQTLVDADTALMSGKNAGRSRTVQFDATMRAEALNSAALAEEMRTALANSAFVPFFQPQVDADGRIVGLEALARWEQGAGRYEAASSFIDVANDTGLVGQIDRMIYAKSLDTLCALEKSGFGRLTVSVNLSAQQLWTDGIVEVLLDALFERDLAPSAVSIEVLESTLLDSRAERINANINALAAAGFTIELDDFGSGHTALASLTAFPVHRIKIDRSLISGIDGDATKRAVVSGLLLVCNKLDIEVLAEGVETGAEFGALNDMGFRQFQGFYFSEAIPEAELLSWLERQPPLGAPHEVRQSVPIKGT